MNLIRRGAAIIIKVASGGISPQAHNYCQVVQIRQRKQKARDDDQRLGLVYVFARLDYLSKVHCGPW